MPEVNPGIAKGYALDFASPLRFVAEQLNASARTLDELGAQYEHDRGDLARVWDHELRERGQRRSAREDVQAQREAEAKRWLLAAAIGALGTQVRADGDGFALAVPLEALRFRGIPVVIPPEPVGGEARASRAARKCTGRGGAGRTAPAAAAPAEPIETKTKPKQRRKPEPAPEPEPPPPHPLQQWMTQHGYTEARLARALAIERGEIAGYLMGEPPVPRVVWLALWALERGAKVQVALRRGGASAERQQPGSSLAPLPRGPDEWLAGSPRPCLRPTGSERNDPSSD